MCAFVRCSNHECIYVYDASIVCVDDASTNVYIYMHAHVHKYIRTFVTYLSADACIHTYMHAYIHTCMHENLHTYIHTVTQSCMSTRPPRGHTTTAAYYICQETYIHIYIRVYILTYIHTHSYSVVHVDEASTRAYHYSCVLYLSEDSDYKGGNFVFTDPDPKDKTRRVLTRVSPGRGNAVMFSSGWENVHYVDAVTEGER